MNERILIVDEDKNIRDLLASALKASGYGVLEAQSFAQARMLALSHCPDLMLLELNLPDGDGLDLIRFLRAQMDLPMVVVSVRAHQRDKVEALDGGADDYISPSASPSCWRVCARRCGTRGAPNPAWNVPARRSGCMTWWWIMPSAARL